MNEERLNLYTLLPRKLLQTQTTGLTVLYDEGWQKDDEIWLPHLQVSFRNFTSEHQLITGSEYAKLNATKLVRRAADVSPPAASVMATGSGAVEPKLLCDPRILLPSKVGPLR